MIEIQTEVQDNRFPALISSLDRTIEDALDAGVAAGIPAADANTRVDTGKLKANKSIEKQAGARVVTWNQDYAAYQDVGTRYMDGTDFSGAFIDAASAEVDAQLAGWPG
jgi:hypothetical protein